MERTIAVFIPHQSWICWAKADPQKNQKFTQTHIFFLPSHTLPIPGCASFKRMVWRSDHNHKKNQRGKTSSVKGLPAKKTSAKDIMKKKEVNELFPVVAIGASAGGIEALSSLLENISPKLGMSYVIIQHLAPTM